MINKLVVFNSFAESYKYLANELVNNPEYQTSPRGLKINEILNIIKSQLNYNNGCTLNGVVAINKQLNQLYQQLLGMFKL